MIEERITLGQNTAYALDGLLTLPDQQKPPFTALVLVHGSGPNDMDEHIGNTYFFKDLAHGLAERGIATIRYNKRTFTYGKEMLQTLKGGLTVKEETIDDAILAADFLRADERINSRKIFIAGHSIGAMLAPRIDAEGGNFAGLILLAGTARKLEQVMIDQSNEQLSQLKGVLKWIATKQVKKIHDKLDKIYTMSDEDAKATKIFGNTYYYYLKEWGSNPVEHYLPKTDKPVLITQGDKDFHVSVEKDFNAYQNILAGRENVTFKLYPNLNHLFMLSVYGKVGKAKQEYEVEQQVPAYVLDDLAKWVLAHE